MNNDSIMPIIFIFLTMVVSIKMRRDNRFKLHVRFMSKDDEREYYSNIDIIYNIISGAICWWTGDTTGVFFSPSEVPRMSVPPMLQEHPRVERDGNTEKKTNKLIL